jgi:hypothetical protein
MPRILILFFLFFTQDIFAQYTVSGLKESVKKAITSFSVPDYGISFLSTAHHNYAVAQGDNKSTKKYETYFIEYDALGKFKGNPTLIDGHTSPWYNDKGFSVSRDGKTIVYLYLSEKQKGKNPFKLNAALFNEDLKMLSQQDYAFDEIQDDCSFNPPMVTNDGKVIITAKVNKASNEKYDGLKDLIFRFKVWVASSGNLKGTVVELGDNCYPINFIITETAPDELIFTGFFNSNVAHKVVNQISMEASGVFAAKFKPAEVSFTSKNYQPFKPETVTAIDAKRTDGYVFALGANSLFWDNSNKTYALVADVKFDVEGNNHTEHKSNCKVVIGFDESFKVLYETPIISKYWDSYIASIFTCKINDKVVIVYSQGDSGHYQCRMATLDFKGTILSNKELEGKKGSKLYPSNFLQTADSKLMVGDEVIIVN